MAGRITRTIQIILPGGKASAESVAQIIDTIFTKALEDGERVESVKGNLGTMGELLTIDIVVSSAESAEPRQMLRDSVDDRRR